MTNEVDTLESMIVRISPRENDAATDAPQPADWDYRATAIWRACQVDPATYQNARSFVEYIMDLATGRKKRGSDRRTNPSVETSDA